MPAMARKVASPVSDDSQKENTGVRTRVKAEKMNQKKLSKGKEPMRRRVEIEEQENEKEPEEFEEEEQEDELENDEDDAQDDEEEGEERENASPKGKKRVRLNANGDSRPADSQLKAEKQGKPRGQTLPRDVDGFIPGSIVRVQLKNFVTYDFVEFKPGPYLNMIFGPNGTGKSTIACAICLGLNFPPSVLGRASELNSFVKIGTDSGYIEIELKGPKGKPNLVIRRSLNARTKSSTFTLNGQSATGREINNRMAELNVQISNLCTFLPQDKVSEFAQMTPQQLLRETQRAAGNANLTAWHDTLIGSGKELKSIQELLTADHDHLKTMEERNANLEREVKRFEERRQIERDIELLELILPFREYVEAKERYGTLKEQQRKLHEHVMTLQKRNAPILTHKGTLEREIEKCSKQRERKKTSTRQKFDLISRKAQDNEKMEQTSEDLKNQLENLKTAEKNRLREIHKLEKSIGDHQQELANPPETEDLNEIERERKRVSAERANLNNELLELQGKQKDNVAEESKIKATIDLQLRNLKQLEDASHRKFEALTRWDRDCADAVHWLRDNRHKFKMEVFEPPMLCLTVPNSNFVHAVEGCFSSSALKTFVAQCEEDYSLLNRMLIDTPDAIGRRARIHTWFKVDDGRVPPPPMTQEEMRGLGFDGYAIDYVNCPEGLKWFLKANLMLHRTAIALNSQGVDPTRAMELVSRIGPRGEGGGASYIVGTVYNNVSRSKYGKRLPQNTTRTISQARNLVSEAIDQNVKRGYEMTLADSREQLAACKQAVEALAEAEAAIRNEDRKVKAELQTVIERKEAVDKVTKRLTSLQLQIDREQKRLQQLRIQPPVDKQRAQLKTELVSLARQRASIVKDYVKLVKAAIKEQEEATRLGLQQAQLAANKQYLEDLYKEKEEEQQRALAEYQEVNKKYAEAKQESKAKLALSKAKLESVDDELRERFKEIEERGEAREKKSEQVLADLEEKRAQLDMNMHTNAGVVEQYRRRQAEIETLTKTIEERERKAGRIERAIKTARDHWQPALEALVSSIGKKFSAAFDRLGCAGEVRISEHEDYDKWAIDILVKFRDEEKLQLLTGERQSGGERSLTTILYLMSLTEEARAPFSLVDEINQGMDQRAERAIHNSLVEVTCKADSGQYFLITPKLLPDLDYAERMKVLCVNNGEWLPDETRVGNMMSMIEAYVKHKHSKGSM
ncbi:P-loop containing nucleoside triphosphate hydrolase protein [Laetiporus sulphureus 93-53]|uniref:Structural maintenance of chromosomes protein 5 n=1 Tax=Laetiporus sulphureus 93-53 TaxID=1314785 RepID=A0A165E8R9_9APHY|nr:P-loop containing nucleoside triphosphate hydrolase protein [Laetiporus sulphureus 93-53]KZT06482.1 P-loop containing nucleoside triphosphate hydrolase protein [Laetiporus sulphureus 93-53]